MSSSLDKILSYANKVNKIQDNEFFARLPKLPLDHFILSHVHFGSAVDCWSKVLGLLIALAPSYKERAIILRNLNDEHGNGDITQSHVATFEKFLSTLISHTKHDLQYYKEKGSSDFVAKFVDELLVMADDTKLNWNAKLAALGMIEYVYINVSEYICEYVTKLIGIEEIEHYSIHNAIDYDHAMDFFKMLNYDTDKTDIEAGIKYGYQILSNFYENSLLLLPTTTSL
jgi:hypothetical protein